MKNALLGPLAANRALQQRLRPAGPAFLDAAPEGQLRVATWNVHKCVGTDGKFDPARTARVIAELGADVLALQEVDKRFGDRQGLLDLARLTEATGLHPVPVRGLRNAHGWCGNLILARNASVGEVRQITLPGLEPRGALIADLTLPDLGELRVIGAHFGLLRRSRRQQMAHLLGALSDLPRPALLMGDLNEWRPSGHSPFDLTPQEFGALPEALASFPSRFPILALDRIIPNRANLIGTIRVHDTPLARKASDHLPLCAQISVHSGLPE